MTVPEIEIRQAHTGDAGAVAECAAALAQSFPFSRAKFDRSFPALITQENACLLVAAADGDCAGYVLGFSHLTFYANGPVGWVEEILVRHEYRERGVGRMLMTAYEQWAAHRDCTLVALATRRAAPFYRALGYQESAVYLRKLVPR